MRNRYLKNQLSILFYDKQVRGKKLLQIKKSFLEVAGILQSDKQKSPH